MSKDQIDDAENIDIKEFEKNQQSKAIALLAAWIKNLSSSIGDLSKRLDDFVTQDEQIEANQKYSHKTRRILKWLIISVVLDVCLSLTVITIGIQVRHNIITANSACKANNKTVLLVNGKFKQLRDVFNQAIKEREEQHLPPLSPSIERAFSSFNLDMPTQDC